MPSLQQQFQQQQFPNSYALVNGVQMHAENGERFQIPHPLLKKHASAGMFVELRIDSPRFSVHADAPVKCVCPTCQGEATKPILSHEHPSSLAPLPAQAAPSRGWGEDFWVQIRERFGQHFEGVVDNPLVEARLHGLRRGDSVFFHEDHILAVHGTHRDELLLSMEASDLRELAFWYESQRRQNTDETS